MIHVALYQPAIPQNTGNIARLCVGMNAHLHIIGPIIFDMSDRAVRRAGLDYWPYLTLTHHETPAAFLDWLGSREPWLITKHGTYRFDQAPYADEDVLLLGNENTGLPEDWHARWPHRRIHIPMPGNSGSGDTFRGVRSYNLANTAAIVLATAIVRV